MTIRELQAEVNIRWEKQLDNPCHRSADATHALVHIMKAAGKLADVLNEAAHNPSRYVEFSEADVARYLADLVILAARFGGSVVDLEAACEARLAEKFKAK